jgi:energy-converting hydrogenase Eha subunit A
MDFTQFTMDSNPTYMLLKRSIFMGLLTVVAGYLASMIVKPILKVDLPEVCKQWNKKYLMEVSLFFTGFILYFGIKYLNVRY